MDSESGSNIPLGFVGLQNLRNTCYMNAVIQCLSQCRDFYKFLSDLNEESLTDERLDARLTKYLKQLLDAIWHGEFSVLTPLSFHNCLSVIYPDFGTSRQQDCQEFLRVLFDNLHEALKYDNSEDSAISDMFRGAVQNEIKCSGCGATSCSIEEFYDLPLTIPEDDDKTLYNNHSTVFMNSQDAEFYSSISNSKWNKLKGFFSKNAGVVTNLYDCLLEFTKQEYINDKTNL